MAKFANGLARQDEPTAKDDPLLSPVEVARQLGKHPNTIRSWIRDGLLAVVRMPTGLFLVRKSLVNNLLRASALNKEVD